MFDVQYNSIVSYLSSNSWEFEGLEGLVIDGGTWIDVDHHAGGSSTTEETLQDPGQFAVSEGHHLRRSWPVDTLGSYWWISSSESSFKHPYIYF